MPGGTNWKEPKVFRKGEVIYHASEPATHVYLIQSGLVALMHPAGDTWLEIGKVTAPQLFGEEVLWGAEVSQSTATALNDTRVIMIPADLARTFFDRMPAALKLVFRSMIQKQNSLQGELQSVRMESDPTPCPAGAVTKLFATLYTVASYSGTAKGDETQVVWQTFKKYAQRTFLESPVRLEQAALILVKLGLARLEMVQSDSDPEAPEELGFVYFRNLELVRDFFQFYREHSFKNDLIDALDAPSIPKDRSQFFRAVLEELEQWNREGRVTLPTAEEDTSEAA